MSKTTIEWADEVWNPTLGCSPAKGSEQGGCKHCYAQRSVHVRSGNPNAKIKAANEGLTVITSNGPVWNGKVRLLPDRLDVPLRKQKPTRYFVNSLSDLFHRQIPREFVDRVFAVMALCQEHTFLVLTKQAERMLEYCSQLCDREVPVSLAIVRTPWWDGPHITLGAVGAIEDRISYGPLPNVWFGVSVENKANLHRIDTLRKTPAGKRFVSFEPLLEDLGELNLFGIDQAIFGGESGPGARPCSVSWIRSGVSQCRPQGCAPFVKQLGANVSGDWPEFPLYDPDVNGYPINDRKGGNLQEFPTDLQVREYPK